MFWNEVDLETRTVMCEVGTISASSFCELFSPLGDSGALPGYSCRGQTSHYISQTFLGMDSLHSQLYQNKILFDSLLCTTHSSQQMYLPALPAKFVDYVDVFWKKKSTNFHLQIPPHNVKCRLACLKKSMNVGNLWKGICHPSISRANVPSPFFVKKDRSIDEVHDYWLQNSDYLY